MNLRILLAESDSENVLFLRDVLEEMESSEYWSGWLHLAVLDTPSCSLAESVLASGPVDCLLLSLNLSDSHGAETFRRVQAAAPHVPVVLLVEEGDLETAARLVREGAQDFLVKKSVDCRPLAHALRNAVERHRLLTASRAGGMTDPLTGLLNRTAFDLFADRDRRIAERCADRMAILLAEPRNLTAPRGAQGEQQRDLKLIETADRLRALAGPTDLVARIDSQRFAISIVETLTEQVEIAWARFRNGWSAGALAIGMSIFNPNRPVTLPTLLEQAERDLAPAEALTHQVAAH